MTNATELFHADGRKAGVWFCSKCRRVYGEGLIDLAAQCCEPKICARCNRPYDAEKWVYTVCRPCKAIDTEERAQATWNKATKIDGGDYAGGVYSEDGDEYHSDIDCFLESLYDDFEERPEHLPRIYATKPLPFRIDAHSLVDLVLEGHHEDAHEQMTGIGDLQELLDAWCQVHDPGTVVPDYEHAIVYEHLLDWPVREPEGK